jgi:hypothetical protein
MKVSLGDPVVVAVSKVNERVWGVHQFPALSRLPDGRILLMWHDAPDADYAHGSPGPAVVSADQGVSWQPFSGPPVPARPHFSVSEVFDGEYLVVPSRHYLNVKDAGVAMPEPRSLADCYGKLMHYRLEDFPQSVQDYFTHLECSRYLPRDGAWHEQTVVYEHRNVLAWKREGSDFLCRTYFERPLLKYNGQLLYADYRGRFALDDGFVPAKGSTTLMVSSDNAHSFQRRATIAADRSGKDLFGEPVLAPTADGRLVCVLRRADQDQKPMAINWSDDGGRTWTAPRDLCEFGVFPGLQLLGNGVLALSYGRPGVWMRFAVDGAGLEWSDPLAIIPGDPAVKYDHSCGYTSLLPISDDELLLAYSDFQHRDVEGNTRKAILARRVRVRR